MEKHMNWNFGLSEQTALPRKSVVQIKFPGHGHSLAYYNDRFDLQIGDLVYVDGKMEGRQGRVVEITYQFKIKRSDYRNVIALVDTTVKGRFCFAGTHFVTFDRRALPAEQAASWFMAPRKEEEEILCGSDDTAFSLQNLKEMHISLPVAERGRNYYLENKVVYLSVDGTKGYALVEGSETYEVEFTYRDGKIHDLTCSCFCGYTCKHQFAAMLQLQETLDHIETCYGEDYARSGYFAAVFKGTLFSFAVHSKEHGSVTFG